MSFNVMLALYCRDHFKLMKAIKTPHPAPVHSQPHHCPHHPPPTHTHIKSNTISGGSETSFKSVYELLKASTDPRIRVSDLKCCVAWNHDFSSYSNDSKDIFDSNMSFPTHISQLKH